MRKAPIKWLFVMCVLFYQAFCFGQEKNNEELIFSSQAGSSEAFFSASADDIAKINPDTFENKAESKIRAGLPNFFNKAKSGKQLTVAYIGGSITRSSNQYRNQSLGFIQKMFPDTKVMGINAGVSGSDTDLGACRVYDHVLKYKPDMIFIEFAVNGGFPEGMEGIIRQIIKYDNTIDICIIYTITSAQFEYYLKDTSPPGIQKLEQIAEHYNLPSTHLGLEAATLAKNGILLPKGDSALMKSKIVFSKDGVHPLEAGGDLYASAIARTMIKMKGINIASENKLPEPLMADNWEDAKMVSPNPDCFSAGWLKTDPTVAPHLGAYKSWFPYVMTSEKPGSLFTFRFKGRMFGLFDIGGPEVGQLNIYIDGKPVKLQVRNDTKILATVASEEHRPINRFNKFCNNRYRGQYFFAETEYGEHTVTFEISDEIPDKRQILGANQQEDISVNFQKYNRSVIYIGKILFRGELVPPKVN